MRVLEARIRGEDSIGTKMPRQLGSENLFELETWLESHNMTLNNKLRRDMSDVTPVAQFLKKHVPKLIDMHNYPPRNNTQLKLNNWETFNHKVLTRIGLGQTKTALQNLARGVPGAIECFLFDLLTYERNKIKRILQAKQLTEAESRETDFDDIRDVVTIDVERIIDGKLLKVPQKMVDYSLYEKLCRESNEKDNFISAIQQKAQYLESIIRVKEERISELTEQLAKLTNIQNTPKPAKAVRRGR